MTTLEHVETQVQQLSPSDFAKFREWFHEYEWRDWDRQIERYSKSPDYPQLFRLRKINDLRDTIFRANPSASTKINGLRQGKENQKKRITY